MKKKYFILLTMLITLLSCNQKQKNIEDSVDSVKIDLREAVDKFYLDSISSSVELIPLETNEESLIKGIKRVILADSLIVVWDSSQKIMAFDNKGQYRNMIGSRGQGPKEYINIIDVFYNDKTQQISILDVSLKKILTFSLDGEFVDEDAIPYYAYAFYPSSKGYWLLNSTQDTDSQLIYIDKSTKEIKNSFFTSYKRIGLILTNNFHEDIDKNAYFHFPHKNTIYKLNDTELEPLLHIDFGNMGITNMDINSEEYLNQLNQGGYVGCLNNVYIHKDQLFFSFQKVEEEKNGMQMLETFDAHVVVPQNKLTIYKSNNLKHSEDILRYSNPRVIGLSQGKLIYQITPGALSEKSIKEHNESPLMIEKGLNNITTDSNPILVVYTLK